MKDKGMTAIIILWVSIIGVAIAAFVGWVLNIIQLIHHHDVVFMTVLKCIGIIVAPLGAILGWIG